MSEVLDVEEVQVDRALIQYDITDQELLKKWGFLTPEALQGLEEKYKALPDGKPSKISKELTAGIAEIRDARVLLEKGRSFFKADVLVLGRAIDSKAKGILGRLQSIEAPFVKEKKKIDDEKARIIAEEEETERKRKELISSAIETLRNYREISLELTSTQIENLIEELDGTELTEETYQERLGEAKLVKFESIKALAELAKIQAKLEEEDRARIAEDLRLKGEREKLDQEKRDLEAEKEKNKPFIEKVKDFAQGGKVEERPDDSEPGIQINNDMPQALESPDSNLSQNTPLRPGARAHEDWSPIEKAERALCDIIKGYLGEVEEGMALHLAEVICVSIVKGEIPGIRLD